MANALGAYDPIIYAQLALLQLEKQLGMARRVFRGYDKEQRQRGSVININRPTYFTAQSMPISSANTTDLTPNTVAITLNQWYGDQFRLNDKEKSYTQEQIVADHLRPLAIAVADKIDQTINALATGVPWYYPVTATAGVADLPNIRRRMFDNKVPLSSDVHLELNGEREAYFLSQDAFNKANESADGGATQMRGTLGQKFGFEIFANQNVPAQITGGTLAETGAGGFTVGAAVTVGQTTLTVAASTMSGTLLVGDIVQVGHTDTTGLSGVARTGVRNFVVTAAATATSNSITFSIAPAASHTVASGTAAIFKIQAATSSDNLAFSRNAIALAMAPLPDEGNGLGMRVASVADPSTGLAIRYSIFAVPLDGLVYHRMDALWGVELLDRDMAVRYVS